MLVSIHPNHTQNIRSFQFFFRWLHHTLHNRIFKNLHELCDFGNECEMWSRFWLKSSDIESVRERVRICPVIVCTCDPITKLNSITRLCIRELHTFSILFFLCKRRLDKSQNYSITRKKNFFFFKFRL